MQTFVKCFKKTNKLLLLVFCLFYTQSVAEPTTEYEFSVKENQKAGTIVGNFNSDDSSSFNLLLFDENPYKQFIQSSFDNHLFTKGIIKTSKMLDHEDISQVEMKFLNPHTEKFVQV